MQKFNFHTHTKRCRHAEGEDADYAEAALKSGICELGFSDHVPCPGFPDGYYSSFRMLPEQTGEYIASINSLKNAYRSKMSIYTGFEVEYYPALFDGLLDFLAPFKPEYFMLGQHFTNNETDGVYSGWSCGEDTLTRYCEQTCEAVKTGRFSCVAHPDIINYSGSEDAYRRAAQKLCRCAKEENIPLEFNLLGLRTGRHYPSLAFFEAAAEAGCKVVLGADAHSPDVLRDTEQYRRAQEILDGLGIKPEATMELRDPFYGK